jgi:membrane-associated phospholipid phosphatase
MDAILQNGIQIVLSFQNLGTWLKTPAELLSFLGTEYFFLIVIASVYWVWSTSLGIRIGLLVMISLGLNGMFKFAFHQPRPYWYDIWVKGMAQERTFGIPSGHAQNSVVFFGGIAAWIRRPWAWILAVLFVLFISLSRIYLGVHFPTDILAGWLAGAVILIVYLALENPVKEWLAHRSTAIQILIGFLGSIIIILLFLFSRGLLGAYTVPLEWIKNAQMAFPNSIPINPLGTSWIYSIGGALFGLSMGVALLNKQGGLNTSGFWWQRLLRILVGLVGVIILYLGLSLVFPNDDNTPANLLRYLRYAVVGLWISWLAPLLFFILKLAEPLRN